MAQAEQIASGIHDPGPLVTLDDGAPAGLAESVTVATRCVPLDLEALGEPLEEVPLRRQRGDRRHVLAGLTPQRSRFPSRFGRASFPRLGDPVGALDVASIGDLEAEPPGQFHDHLEGDHPAPLGDERGDHGLERRRGRSGGHRGQG